VHEYGGPYPVRILSDEKRCVIVGASHAAAQLALSLRQYGWDGSILVIGEEKFLPYQRPPLSKGFMAGEKTLDEILIRKGLIYDKNDVEFRLGVRVIEINRDSKTLLLDDGTSIAYGKLALTMGARARKLTLPGSDLPGVCYLRNLEDVERIQSYVEAGKEVVVCGGGYIGLETAASLKQQGMNVTVLEMMPRILERVVTPELSAFYTRVHKEEGVKIVTGVTVTSFEGEERVQRLVSADGQVFQADLVVVGVGVVPNVELAETAGLSVNNGIVVDQYAQTSDPDIVAAGDCTFHLNPMYQRELRLESVQNAVDQAKIAAASLCGHQEAYDTLPWFWSDQFDIKLQIAGLSQGYDDVVIRGDINLGRSFAVFYLRKKMLISVDAVNRPQEFMVGKRLIKSRKVISRELLAEEAVPIKNLLTV